jgi:putative peptidoglycan lipid II flippase
MAPALTNTVVVGLLVLLRERLSIVALVVAWLAGAAAALLLQLPAVLKVVRAMPRPEAAAGPSEIAPALREGGVIFTSSTVTKAVEVVDRMVASLVASGAISALYLSFRIIHLPFSMLSLALSRAIAPELSRLRGERDGAGFSRLLGFAVDLNLLLLAPVVALMMLLAEDVVAVFYGRGSFDGAAIATTSKAFFYYALAIVPMGFIGLLTRVYSALEDNRVPLLAAAVGGVTNIGLDLVLYQTRLAHGGIALASAIGLAVQAALMLAAIRRFGVVFEWRQAVRTAAAVLPGLVLLVAAVMVLREGLPAGAHLGARCLRLVVGGGAGAALYAVLVLALWPRRRPRRLRVALIGLLSLKVR